MELITIVAAHVLYWVAPRPYAEGSYDAKRDTTGRPEQMEYG